MKLVMEKRLAPSPLMRSLVPVVAAFAALVFCGIFFAVTGRDPFEVYYAMFSGALGSEYGISETIVKMIPLAMCGLGIAIAFRMQIWNIGAEGQFYMGACAASWLPLTYPDLPSMIMLPGMLLLGAAAGGMWGLLAGWFKTKWLVSELITTLMMNYIAILWVNYLVYGAWRDPKGLNFPLTAGLQRVGFAALFRRSARTCRYHYCICFSGSSDSSFSRFPLGLRDTCYWFQSYGCPLCRDQYSQKCFAGDAAKRCCLRDGRHD